MPNPGSSKYFKKVYCWNILDWLLYCFANIRPNIFHNLVWINGSPLIDDYVYIGGFSEVNAKNAKVIIGEHCDIASFVVINCADSHWQTLGLGENVRKDITIEDHVFIGTMTTILGGTKIGHHSVIGAGCLLEDIEIPPYSKVTGNRLLKIERDYYKKHYAD